MFLIDDILAFGGAALFGGFAGGAASALIGFVIDVFLDEDSLSDEVRVRYPNALKLLIQKKKKTAVKVGIFNDYKNKPNRSVDISASKGVSDNLYEGQVIYL